MNKRKASLRIGAVAAIFCFACFIFTARLVSLQLINRDAYAPTSAAVSFSLETVIRAQRGEICDRNGTTLVYNDFSYNLTINYNTLPSTVRGENELFLEAARLVREAGAELILTHNYPLAGVYPDMKYAAGEEAEKIKNAIIERYGRKSTITAPELAAYLANRYDLLDSDKNLICTPEEAEFIMRLRWSLIDADFYNLGSYTLAEDIGFDLITVVCESNLAGCTVETVAERKYAYPGYASHILGQLGRIYAEEWDKYKDKGYSMDALVGISGCEKIFEDYLRGVDGVLVTEYNKSGYVVGQYVKVEPIAGRDVLLTIDIDLQIAAEDGLVENIEYAKERATVEFTGEDASAGAFTMVDVNNGQVLAMASNPTYDLTYYNDNYNAMLSAEVSPLLNRAINGLYAPGSTFKIGVAAAAIANGTISSSTVINTKGIYTYFPDYHPRCWYYISTGLSHGAINVSEALRVSCNCYFYEVGRLLGIDKMNEYFISCGLGQSTGFELGGATGILAGPSYRTANGLALWRETDTIVAAIGQSENLSSPLQINMYIAAIANGGTRYAATIFYGVKDFNAEEGVYAIPPAAPVVLSKIELSSHTRSVLLESMKSVVTTSPTLTSFFRGLPVSVGGKTGTAQVGTTQSENGLFVAVAPAENPQIAALCIIEKGHAGTYSGYTISKVFEVYYSKYS